MLRKNAGRSPYKAILSLTVFAGLILILTACNNGKAETPQNTNDTTRTETPPKDDTAASKLTDIDTKLQILYLNNTKSNNELEQLFQKRGGRGYKIVLQFYKLNNGVLTLAAYTGEKGRTQPGRPEEQTDFDSKFIPLHLSKHYPKSAYDLNGKSVLMGDLEISKINQDNGNEGNFGNLKSAVNKKGDEYIVFLPKIEMISGTNTYFITYRVTSQSTNPETKIEDESSEKLVDFSINPSPPARRL